MLNTVEFKKKCSLYKKKSVNLKQINSLLVVTNNFTTRQDMVDDKKSYIQCPKTVLSNCIVYINHLGRPLKCKFQFSKSGMGPEILHF